jgi:hypothetical protein
MGIMSGIAGIISGGKAPEVDLQDSKKRNEELWGKDSEARKPQEQQWQLCVSMVMGNQWCGWSGTTVLPLQAPTWRIQSVDNKLFVRTRSKMTNLLADSTPQFLPEGAENIDLRRARYKERVLNHVSREIGLPLIKARAAQYVSTLGACYTEAYWNATAGDTYADDAGAFSVGEAGLKIYSPFEVWPAAGASAGNNGGRLWTAEIVPVELARLKWSNKEIEPDAAELSDLQLRANLDSYFQSGGQQISSGNARKQLEECCLVKTLREYRTAANPQGRKSIIINGKTYDENPLLWDGMTHIMNFPAFQSYFGDPVELRLSIQPQKSINRLESNWEEYVRTMAKGKILLHGGTKVKSSSFDSEHAEIIETTGSGPAPEPWMPPAMPSDTINLINLRSQTIDDIYSDHMASQGKSPASASGAAINYLIEADQEQHTLTRDLWNAGWERTYEKLMDVVASHSGPNTGYTADRMITILGENRRADVEPVDMALLEGKNRVRIVIGGELPTNKTLRAELLRRWYDAGIFGPPGEKETNRKFLKMAAAGIFDDVMDDDALDEIRQEKENKQLAIGVRVSPRPEDNHAVHIWSLKHWMKSDDFPRLPLPIQELAYDHLAVHEQQIALKLAGMAAMAAGQNGGKPGAQPGRPVNNGPTNSPAAAGPGDMLKSVQQGGEAPPAAGAPGPTQPA